MRTAMESLVDPNNNASCGKYSLRPRAGTRNPSQDLEVEEVKKVVRTKRKSSQRCQPLSRYRRKSANARERSRMKEINEAFETLRQVVSGRSEVLPGEKTTKISTLRLAMQYITTLQEMLQECPGESIAELEDVGEKTSEVVQRLKYQLEPTNQIVSPLSDLQRPNCSSTSDSTTTCLESSFSMIPRMAIRKPSVEDFVKLTQVNNPSTSSSAFIEARESHDIILVSHSCSSTSSVKPPCENSKLLTGTVSNLKVGIQCDSLQNKPFSKFPACGGNSLSSSIIYNISNSLVKSSKEFRDSFIQASSSSELLHNPNSGFSASDFDSNSPLLTSDIEVLPFQTLEEMFI